jgi:hypothetical protein
VLASLTLMTPRLSLTFKDQRFATEIDQHRMVLEVKTLAEGIKATIPRPSRSALEQARQLVDQNFLTQRVLSFVHLGFGGAANPERAV